VLFYVANVLYPVLPALHERLDEAWELHGIDAPRGQPALIRPGSWVGGDMDGNPNVTASTVRETLKRHRELVIDRYRAEVTSLARQLSQSDSRVEWNEQIDRLTATYGDWFPECAAAVPARHRGMGYRVLLTLVEARLEATAADAVHAYDAPSGFLDDIDAVAESLMANGGANAGLFRVDRLRRRIRAFGFHLATLDVRQDARELRDVMAAALSDPGWAGRSATERAEHLRSVLTNENRIPDVDSEAESVAATLDVFHAIAEGRERYGPDAIGSYIISMAKDVDDLLTVLWLERVAAESPRRTGGGSSGEWTGEAEATAGEAEATAGEAEATAGGADATARREESTLDVVPLFETVYDLERSEEVLDRLFVDPVLAPHIMRRERRQQVMVGYSDSNKDGGVASARWALQQALEGMSRAARRAGVTLTVFHGRGGTVSRGGGSVHRAVAAMPAASIGGRLRLTEQGEVIDAKYGLAPIALRNLERMLGSIVVRGAEADTGEISAEWRAIADTVADAARSKYRGLVYDDERFKTYFRHATPIDVIERMSIGSRPASRRAGAGVEDLRAIPWVFSWTQCRAMITGWYGLGSALESAQAEHGLEALCDAAKEWPFFDALLADVEMVLAKADLGIASSYSPLAPAGVRGVHDDIVAEFERTVSHILAIRRSSTLLENELTLQRSIRLRNPYVDPMNILQVDLLARWRDADRPEGPLFSALLATVNGIARGLQNTG
jgi:phosphoenolpyruvate carboxylase